jgi:hypothetical protein
LSRRLVAPKSDEGALAASKYNADGSLAKAETPRLASTPRKDIGPAIQLPASSNEYPASSISAFQFLAFQFFRPFYPSDGKGFVSGKQKLQFFAVFLNR